MKKLKHCPCCGIKMEIVEVAIFGSDKLPNEQDKKRFLALPKKNNFGIRRHKSKCVVGLVTEKTGWKDVEELITAWNSTKFRGEVNDV